MAEKGTGRPGDRGCTRDGRGRKIEKGGRLAEALGRIDSLGVELGAVVLAWPEGEALLRQIQEDLMVMAGRLAGCRGDSVQREPAAMAAMEEQIELGASFSGFIQPGVNPRELACHRARTAARAAERSVWSLDEGASGRETAGRYLNRLSDYLFSIIHT